MEAFEIIQVRRGGNDDRRGSNNDRGSGYVEGRIDVKVGPYGSEWSASMRGGYEDERGNYADVEVKKNDQGETLYSGSAGCDNKK